MTFQEILARFPNAKKNGDGYTDCCPAHPDRDPSLSIKEGDDGRTLLLCRAGCATENIVAAKGLRMADLFPPEAPGSERHNKPDIIAVYDYTDATGKLLFQVVREAPKNFKQRHPDPANPSAWIWKMQGIERVLYRLPEVLSAVKSGETIYITEGEKDADKLAAEGLVATTNSGGASMRWLESYTESIKNAVNVVIVADKDDAGRKHSEEVRAALDGKVGSLAVVELPDWKGRPVKDAADFFYAGATVFEFVECVRRIIEKNKEPEAVDAAYYIRTAPPPCTPIIEGIFDDGDKVPVIGSSKARKSFFVLQLAISVATGRPNFLGWKIPSARRVLILQLEIKDVHYWRRVNHVAFAMGIAPESVAGRLHVASLRGKRVNPELILRLADKHKAELIIIDPLYKLTEGDENKAEDMKPTLAMFDRLAEESGAAVMYVHHNAKGTAGDRDTRDRGAGSGVLARDFDACMYLTEHRDAEGCELDGLCVIETLLRNYPPQEPFTVAWEMGHFQVQNGIEAVVKTSTNKNSAKSQVLSEKITSMRMEHPSMGVREIARQLDINPSTVSRHLKV